MHGEAPEFKRCCFCLPLRRGLLAWGYTKMVLNLLSMTYVVASLVWYLGRARGFDARDTAIITVIMACLVIDLCFDVIFIVASHKKSVRLLNVSYIYNILWLSLVLLGNCFLIYLNLEYLRRGWRYEEYRMFFVLDFLFSAGVAFSLIFVQIYLLLLIRSEMAKLRKQSLQIQFSNHLASGEPQCTLHNACLANQCVGEKQVVQDCTGETQVVHDCTGETQVVQDCCTGEEQVCCTKEKSPV